MLLDQRYSKRTAALDVEKFRVPGIRVQSIDILRGLVMIIMAIDHVRVFSGVLPGGPDAGIFFTRWITHFCAPAFTFFAGTSAYLVLQKNGSSRDLSKFLLTRGLFLVILEMTLVRFLWTFNFDYVTFVHTNIIWTLGWCMILLAFFVKMSPFTVGRIGLALILFQQLFQFIPYILPPLLQEVFANVWYFFYPSSLATQPVHQIIPGFALPEVFGITIVYVIIPWLGVMMAGFAFGHFFTLKFDRLRQICLRIGFVAVISFILFGSLSIALYSESQAPIIFQLLGQHKYPPSQLFLLMTLGPIILLIPFAEKMKGKVADILKVIGKVPMFYYLFHLLLIHLSAFVVNMILYGNIHHDWYTTSPLVGIAENQRWDLWIIYVVWAIDMVPLYFACRWYLNFKSRNPNVIWLKYV